MNYKFKSLVSIQLLLIGLACEPALAGYIFDNFNSSKLQFFTEYNISHLKYASGTTPWACPHSRSVNLGFSYVTNPYTSVNIAYKIPIQNTHIFTEYKSVSLSGIYGLHKNERETKFLQHGIDLDFKLSTHIENKWRPFLLLGLSLRNINSQVKYTYILDSPLTEAQQKLTTRTYRAANKLVPRIGLGSESDFLLEGLYTNASIVYENYKNFAAIASQENPGSIGGNMQLSNALSISFGLAYKF